MAEGFGGEGLDREKVFSETLVLMAKITETGGALDPVKLAGMRAKLRQNLGQFGVLDGLGHLKPDAWMSFLAMMSDERRNPAKPANYPAEEKFRESYGQVVSEEPDFIDNVSGRGGRSLESYLYGLGIVMASEVAYREIFRNDPITLRAGKVENGRHRVLTERVLDRCGFIRNWSWVERRVEG